MMFDYENPSEGYKNFSERMRQLGNMPAHEYADAYMKQMNLDESALPTAQQGMPQGDSWGFTRGFKSGALGVLQGQAQLSNLMGIGDGATANALGESMQNNARKKNILLQI